jgi:hypothetical protein
LRLGWTLALWVWLGAPQAAAGEAAGRELTYAAPESCPGRAEFSEQIALRTPEWTARRAELDVSVEIAPEASGLVGRVRFVRAGRETLRELRAESCGELVRALALIVAILIDPQADMTPAPARRPPPMARPAPAPVPAPGPAPPASSSVALFFVVGPEVVGQTGVTPGLAFGERVFVALGRGEGDLWASSLRLAFTRLRGSATSAESGAEASFEVDSGRLEGGVRRFVWGELALEPGVVFELGRLRAVGQHPLGRVAQDRVWASAGATLRPTVTLARRLVLGAAVGLHVPLVVYRFAFVGERVLYQNEALGLDAALTLGVRFP